MTEESRHEIMRWMSCRGNTSQSFIQCPFIYVSVIHYFNSKHFFKKFKYLLGTQVKKTKNFAKTKTKTSF